MRGSDFSIAVTHEDADFAANLAQVRPEIVATGLSSLLLDQCNSSKVRGQVPEGPFAAFVGFFDHHANIEGIGWYIRCIHPAVVRAIPGYKLLVIGGGDTSSLRALAQDDPTIVFTGWVDDLALEIRKAAICIAPLISGAGIRGKINQYTACERPTISTTIGASGMPYVSGDSIFIADQPEDFSRHMIELLRSETLRAKMTKEANEIVEQHFSWNRIIPQLESVYYGH
jgi:glycosyltransferase involved in cell wall biosynthesis